MLRRLRVRNFKSWPELDIEFGKITGLFGTNSSGKSSILQFLLLLKQTKEATDRGISLALEGPYTGLGGYRDMIYRHEVERPLAWSLAFGLESDLSLIDPGGKRTARIVKSDHLEIESEVGVHGENALSRRLAYTVGHTRFALAPKGASESEFELTAGDSAFKFVRTRGRSWQLPRPVKSYAFPDQARTYFQNAAFLADIEAAYEQNIDAIFYLGPLREFPERDYSWPGYRPQHVGFAGENTVDAILAATDAKEMRNLRKGGRRRPFQQIVAHWLKHLDVIDDFRVEEIAPATNRWQVRVRTRKSGSEALLTDVGFGVSQVLPVIVLLQYVPRGATVILEQPEIHLHPFAQAGLADVIINAATHRGVQILLESHSEHLLLRLQRRVAEEKICADDIKLYFCDATTGASKLEALDLNLFGQIANWPKGFMGDAFGETYAAEQARLERMNKAAAE